MALKQKVSMDHYLAMPEEKPYREYLFGEVVEKSMPKFADAVVQAVFVTELRSWAKGSHGLALPELRCILRTPIESHVQLPDVAWFSTPPDLQDGNAVTPPLLAIEVLSPDDRFVRVQNKIQVYLHAGVKLVWVADPETETVSVYRPGQPPVLLEGVAVLEDPLLPALHLSLRTIFHDLQDTPETK